MERRRINLSLNKDGHGTIGFRISLPTNWVKKMGLDNNNRRVFIEFDNNKIIIKKELIDMLLIKNRNGKYLGERYDYELENGLLLFSKDWNGESYVRALDSKTDEWNNNSFRAICRYEEENIDISEIDDDSPEWEKVTEIVGFVEQ